MDYSITSLAQINNTSLELDEDLVNKNLNDLLNYDSFECPKKFSELDMELIKHLITNTLVDMDTGRLIMPCLWNNKLIKFLPNNFYLANSVLKSILKKYKKEPLKLEAYNNVIFDQLNQGIIQPVEINTVKNNNKVSFLAHNAVFRDHVETTKCRIVYLSNLCDKNQPTNLSHNNVSLPGPNLNNRLDIALTLLRFNKYLLVFDLERAFHQIKLPWEDTEKFHFLGFKK